MGLFPVAIVSAAVVVGALLWFVWLPVDSAVSSDDGAYAIQARAVAEGSWSVPHVLADVDPTGLAYPYQNATISERGMFPAAGHAAWTGLQSLAWRAGGAPGFHVFPVLGLLGCVAVSAGLATALGRPELRWQSAALAALSPLLYNSLQLWAHAVVAALVGVALWAAVRCAGRVNASCAVVLLVASGMAGVIRDDGAVFALAIALVLVVDGAVRRRWTEMALGATACAASLAGYLIAETLTERITGPVIRSTAGLGGGETSRVDSLGSFIRGAVHTFVTSADEPVSFLLTVAAAGSVAIAMRAAGQEASARVATGCFAAAAALLAVRTVLFPEEPITGLIGAFPLVLLVVARPVRALATGERLVLASMLLGGLGIALTQYDGGGGLNWGGRFVAASIPGLVVLMAAGAERLGASASADRWLGASVVAVAVVCAASSLVADASIRLRHDRIIGRLEGADSSLAVVTSNPAVARVAWRTYPETEWLGVPEPEGEEGAALLRQLLGEAGIADVNLFGVPPEEVTALVGGGVPSDTERPVTVAVPK